MATRKAEHSGPALEETLARRLAGAVLPGDAGFEAKELVAAAQFVFDAAIQRKPDDAALHLDSVTGPVGERFTRIAVINNNMPFLVDSLAAAITAHGLIIDRLVHPIVTVERDRAGRLLDLPDKPGKKTTRESMIYIEATRADARTRVRLRGEIEAVLSDVRAAVTDWPHIRQAMLADAERLERRLGKEDEGAALLRWLNADMLTQLGHVVRHRDGTQSDALGICRESAVELLAPASFEGTFTWFEQSGRPAPLIIKANHMCRVHRRVPLDLFIVPVIEKGVVTALSVHAGVWTSAALAARPDDVPRMRTQLANLMEKLDFEPQSHSAKALIHAMTALPHDLLVGFDDTQLERACTAMMSLIDRPRPHLVLVRSPLDRHLFAFVWLPRDSLSTTLRVQIQSMLAQAARAQVLDWSQEVEGNLVLIRFVLDVRDGVRLDDEAGLASKLEGMVRGWPEAVEAELAADEGDVRAAAIAARYAEKFPLGYRSTYGPAEAAADIRRLRRLPVETGGQFSRDARLHCPEGCPEGRMRLKLYQRRGTLPLSDAVPMLENFGFRVAGEVPTILDAGEMGAIHDFWLELPSGIDGNALLARAPEIEGPIASVLNGIAEDDPFNRLIIASSISAGETEWLRAWYRYLRQTGMTYGVATAVDALQHAPRVARGLVALFRVRHDPDFSANRVEAEAETLEDIRQGLAGVSAINDDRLLRQYVALVEAILRTNAFSAGSEVTPEVTLAFKIQSDAIPGLPRPVPWREIFVYSQRVEGIHLRAGPVARGGLRWSDRRDDFRTEVLGLMKAQRVKNAVIVPTGAKGGFYPKKLPDPLVDREAWAAEGRESYKLFIRSLLSITDNIVDGKVVHPQNVLIRDGEDPYFVVAADKGTATFSDTANAIAAQRDFWLDDAFASGGSNGYDHKAMGITARGAWLSVQRHFLEQGIDVQAESVKVAGCGDMSGDVFGNGMLLSRAIKLVAAFDHRHIFIDPDPDPGRSWKERKRLFTLPRSSWDDYDKALISPGGGVFPRSQKRIELTGAMREVLGVEAESLDPDALIAAILKSPVDLLWFGGIGTYVKGSGQNHVEVGDPANDRVRVDGEELRAKVVGEGANLGCTQAGRIEFALRGGRINTDFIDNSAGVDCSDNEVNIKIALASARRAGRLDEERRVALLGEMTDEVAALVLEDNRLQALALSIAQAGGAEAIPATIRLTEVLEENGDLDRKTEGMADNEELGHRAAEGAGLTRPELAVLLSSSKLSLQAAFERSDLLGDETFRDDLLAAFPTSLQEGFREEILGHRLWCEIIATKVANRMINRMGLIHPFELVEEEGASASQLGTAFIAAERLFDMERVWQAIERAPMPEPARIHLFERAAAALRLHMADLLRVGAGPVKPAELIARLEPGVRELHESTALLGAETREQSAFLYSELCSAGATKREAEMVAALFDLDGAVGVASLASQSGVAAPVLAAAFVDVGARLGLDWAHGQAARMTPSDPWERLLIGGLARDFQQMRLDFLRGLSNGEGKPSKAVALWADSRAPAISQFRAMIGRAQTAVSVTPAMLAQIASMARSLLAR